MASKLRLRAERVTQATFDLLPALLTAYQVKVVTGWTDHELATAVSAKEVKVWQRPVAPGRKRSYRKYLKVSVGRAVGFKT